MATVKKIFELAAAILFTAKGGDTDFDQYSPLLLERLLMEALPYENAIRAADGREELKTAPEVNSIDDTVIDWDDRITRGALPHGLASALMIDEEDKQAQMVLERNYFVQALEDRAPAVLGYGEEDGA
jgi:hypothetical protein